MIISKKVLDFTTWIFWLVFCIVFLIFILPRVL